MIQVDSDFLRVGARPLEHVTAITIINQLFVVLCTQWNLELLLNVRANLLTCIVLSCKYCSGRVDDPL